MSEEGGDQIFSPLMWYVNLKAFITTKYSLFWKGQK
jgi:hypothetical protein